MLTTYPIYILDLDGTDRVVFPEGKTDISHSEFWEETVALVVVRHYGIPHAPLLNLPYCQRRARITSRGTVFYGEQQTKALMKTIRASVGESNLAWEDDEHEQRLPMDMAEFEELRQST